LTSLEKRKFSFWMKFTACSRPWRKCVSGDGRFPRRPDYRAGAGRAIHPFQWRTYLDGATTRAGLITAPLRSRLASYTGWIFYEPADLLIIIHRSAKS